LSGVLLNADATARARVHEHGEDDGFEDVDIQGVLVTGGAEGDALGDGGELGSWDTGTASIWKENGGNFEEKAGVYRRCFARWERFSPEVGRDFSKK
jgi:hypothetical protein